MKKIPMRKCVVSQVQLPKKELLRIVKTPESKVMVDITGRCNGRGAYIKKDLEVLAIAKKKGSLSRALEIKIEDDIYESIAKVIVDGK